eukprot:TRINITY_DN6592_c0_g1_i1.p1 TRINITY_DN6592_c0_g1~~TRINITY_DN6592_c0_g1_i1.p1  ORF type:complete len:115 (+),score=20.99 TRINITY_DN6592_c0_g1_i1:84-428(+)
MRVEMLGQKKSAASDLTRTDAAKAISHASALPSSRVARLELYLTEILRFRMFLTIMTVTMMGLVVVCLKGKQTDNSALDQHREIMASVYAALATIFIFGIAALQKYAIDRKIYK